MQLDASVQTLVTFQKSNSVYDYTCADDFDTGQRLGRLMNPAAVTACLKRTRPLENGHDSLMEVTTQTCSWCSDLIIQSPFKTSKPNPVRPIISTSTSRIPQ